MLLKCVITIDGGVEGLYNIWNCKHTEWPVYKISQNSHPSETVSNIPFNKYKNYKKRSFDWQFLASHCSNATNYFWYGFPHDSAPWPVLRSASAVPLLSCSAYLDVKSSEWGYEGFNGANKKCLKALFHLSKTALINA